MWQTRTSIKISSEVSKRNNTYIWWIPLPSHLQECKGFDQSGQFGMKWRNHQTPRKLHHRSQKTSPQPASGRDKGSAGTAVMHDSDATSIWGTAVTEDTWLNPASLWDLNTFTFGGTAIPHYWHSPLCFFLKNWPSSLHVKTHKVFPPRDSALTIARAIHTPELLCLLSGINVWSQSFAFF